MIAELSQRPLMRPDGRWRWRLSVGAKISYPEAAALTTSREHTRTRARPAGRTCPCGCVAGGLRASASECEQVGCISVRDACGTCCKKDPVSQKRQFRVASARTRFHTRHPPTHVETDDRTADTAPAATALAGSRASLRYRSVFARARAATRISRIPRGHQRTAIGAHRPSRGRPRRAAAHSARGRWP